MEKHYFGTIVTSGDTKSDSKAYSFSEDDNCQLQHKQCHFCVKSLTIYFVKKKRFICNINHNKSSENNF